MACASKRQNHHPPECSYYTWNTVREQDREQKAHAWMPANDAHTHNPPHHHHPTQHKHHTHTHTHTQTHTNTHTNARMHAHTRTHTHTHSQAHPPLSICPSPAGWAAASLQWSWWRWGACGGRGDCGLAALPLPVAWRAAQWRPPVYPIPPPLTANTCPQQNRPIINQGQSGACFFQGSMHYLCAVFVCFLCVCCSCFLLFLFLVAPHCVMVLLD